MSGRRARLGTLIRMGLAGTVQPLDTPQELIIHVTTRCPIGCPHCFVETSRGGGAEPEIHQLVEAVGSVGRPVPFLDFTGGEPFTRKDLHTLVVAVARTAGALRVAIPTSGVYPDATVRMVDAMACELPGTRLSVKVSFEAAGEAHSAVRGSRGLYSKACATHHGLRELSRKHRNLTTGIIFTVIPENIAGARAHLQELAARLSPDVISINYPRPRRVGPDPASVPFEVYEELCRTALSLSHGRRGRLTEGFFAAYKSLVADRVGETVRRGRFSGPCMAGRTHAVITADVKLLACEPLAGRPMGDLAASGCDFGRVWRSREANNVRRLIASRGCACTNECNLQNNLFFSTRGRLSLVGRFALELLRHR